ncbi:helix-turn-helix transcriptional regulator [Aromatoleum buckelii]|uniref:AlpA family phage regulatory protein n=1 Tax=Aromatoleum buckelii TaxID=200254 RepID=A0ABX1N0P7_9RHOO|nr:AlpA family phage regulatory protein [Aromatoleum buckelii]MCK0510154.1 AlpA family phage regulatory protein [Aromatoleum buckelii]
MAAIKQSAPTILRRNQVETRTGLSRSTIYAKMRPNPKRPGGFDPTFPKPIAVGARAVGWIEAEIDGWLAAQIEKSRPQANEAEQARCGGKRTDEVGVIR